MKICFFIDDITKDGGTERCTAVLSSLLAEKVTMKVKIVSINASRKNVKYAISSKVELKIFNEEKIENPLLRRVKTYSCLKKEIKEGRHDVIIVVDTYKSLCFLPFVSLLKRTETKLVSWEHFNFDFGQRYSARWWGRNIAAKISDRIVVLSQADLKDWKKEVKHPEKVKAIYNFPCFVPEKPRFNPDCKTVLAIGRLEEQKGFDYLIDIWKKIEDSNFFDDWKLKIVGSGSLEADLHKKCEELGIRHIEWTGFTQEIESCYRNASLYALTSRCEGFGLVLVEAKSFGIPIVSFDIKNGPNEIVQHNTNGFLIPAFDIDEFALKLGELMKNKTLREKFTKASQSNMDTFSRDKIVKQWIDLLNELVIIEK